MKHKITKQDHIIKYNNRRIKYSDNNKTIMNYNNHIKILKTKVIIN